MHLGEKLVCHVVLLQTDGGVKRRIDINRYRGFIKRHQLMIRAGKYETIKIKPECFSSC